MWAEIASGTQIPIQTVRLPLGFESQKAMERLHGEARRTLQELGFSEEVRALLDQWLTARFWLTS